MTNVDPDPAKQAGFEVQKFVLLKPNQQVENLLRLYLLKGVVYG